MQTRLRVPTEGSTNTRQLGLCGLVAEATSANFEQLFTRARQVEMRATQC